MTPNDFIKGQPILASALNWMMAQCKKVDRIQGVAPIEVSNTSNGILIRLAGRPAGGVAASIVTTAITACSGTTAGAGQVQRYNDDGTTNGDPVDVKNWYTSTGTVATDAHCTIGFDGSDWWLIDYDCPGS